MNLNDCINRLPLILRGRFSSSNNASWLAWTADGLSQIERVSVGPGNKRKVMAIQSKGGFIQKPPSLKQITNAWLDEVQVPSVREKDDRGFPMEKDSVTWEQYEVEVDGRWHDRVYVTLYDTNSAILEKTPITVKYLHLASLQGVISGDLNVSTGDLIGSTFEVNGEEIRITESSVYGSHTISGLTMNGIKITVESASSTYTDEQSSLSYFKDVSLDGMEVFSNGELTEVVETEWVKPAHGATGWSSISKFACTRAVPGRTWPTATSGTLTKSNLVVEGYRRLARPSTITEALDLPEGCEGLMAAYLRWAAEHDQDNASSETAKAEATFSKALGQYAIDQSRTDGATRQTAYQFKVSLTGRRP